MFEGVVEQLLKHGADLNLRNKAGLQAFSSLSRSTASTLTGGGWIASTRTSPGGRSTSPWNWSRERGAGFEV